MNILDSSILSYIYVIMCKMTEGDVYVQSGVSQTRSRTSILIAQNQTESRRRGQSHWPTDWHTPPPTCVWQKDTKFMRLAEIPNQRGRNKKRNISKKRGGSSGPRFGVTTGFLPKPCPFQLRPSYTSSSFFLHVFIWNINTNTNIVYKLLPPLNI